MKAREILALGAALEIAGCSPGPQEGSVQGKPDPDEVQAVIDEICGTVLYEPGQCHEIAPLKMAPKVEKLLCEAAKAMRDADKGFNVLTDDNRKTDLFDGRFPRVTTASGLKDKVYQCGADPETGDGKCVKGNLSGAPDTIDVFNVDMTHSVDVEGGSWLVFGLSPIG